MKRFATWTLLLVLIALVPESHCANTAHIASSNIHSLIRRESSRLACQTLQVNFTASLQFVSEECRDIILPVANFLGNIQNVNASEMFASASCVPDCQSAYDLQVTCVGRVITDERFTFYCGENAMSQACYQAFQINNGQQASSACSNNGDNCTESCRTALQILITEVGCCVNSFPYSALNINRDGLFASCGVNMPSVCPHLFRTEDQSDSRVECQTLQSNFTASLQFVDQECRNSVLPVLNLFADTQNVTASETAAAAVCRPACRSLYDLQETCLGQLESDDRTAFYCGENQRRQACYEAFQLNNGSQVLAACRNISATCTDSCRTELQNLIADVGCCVNSFVYRFLNTANGCIFDTCGVTAPSFCPHLFRTVNQSDFTQACETFARNFTASLEFVDQECRNNILPVIDFLGNFQNVTASEMFAAAACTPACQSLYDLQVTCVGQLVAENRTAFYCGENQLGQACYEAFQLNNGSQAIAACSNIGDTCTDACRTELRNLIADVGCCVNSFVYNPLIVNGSSVFDTCGVNTPDFCPNPFNSPRPTATDATAGARTDDTTDDTTVATTAGSFSLSAAYATLLSAILAVFTLLY